MKSVLSFVALTALAITVPAAHAVDFYVGATVGQPYSTHANGVNDGQSFNADSTNHATPLAALVGVDITAQFGLEAGYKSFGSTRINLGGAAGTALETDAHASYIAAKAMLPLGENWTLNGKLGVAQRHFGVTLSSNGRSASDSSKQSVAYMGLGVAYKLTKNISLTAELEHFGEAQVQGFKLGMDGLTAGVRFGF
jgi:OOP family OmpA-OmpF porin